MSPSAVVVASHGYTYDHSNWQSKLSNIAQDIEDNWNNQIAGNSYDEIWVNSPPLPSGDGALNSPSSSQTPEDYRDGYRSIVAYGTELFDSYDCVIVVTSANMEGIAGIAYVGEPKNEDVPGDHEGQAAGSTYGLGVVFESQNTKRTAYHELLHTFGASHPDGDVDHHPYWQGGGFDSTVMSAGVTGCDGQDNLYQTKFNPSNCAENAVNDYLNDWM